jgi:Ca2+-binding RTX toxin-like protein
MAVTTFGFRATRLNPLGEFFDPRGLNVPFPSVRVWSSPPLIITQDGAEVIISANDSVASLVLVGRMPPPPDITRYTDFAAYFSDLDAWLSTNATAPLERIRITFLDSGSTSTVVGVDFTGADRPMARTVLEDWTWDTVLALNPQYDEGDPPADPEPIDETGTSGPDTMTGEEGDDRLDGAGGDDHLSGGAGNDTLIGGTGADDLQGGFGNDLLDGGAGNDTLFGGHGMDTLYGGNQNDFLAGEVGRDRLYGGNGDDTLVGGRGNDRLFGGNGNDRLNGGGNDDLLYAGAGSDRLTGGEGADTFIWRAASESSAGNTRDRIMDFETGIDRIDISALHPDLVRVAAFTGVAGQVVYAQSTGILSVDITGNSAADFSVALGAGTVLGADDLIL